MAQLLAAIVTNWVAANYSCPSSRSQIRVAALLARDPVAREWPTVTRAYRFVLRDWEARIESRASRRSNGLIFGSSSRSLLLSRTDESGFVGGDDELCSVAGNEFDEEVADVSFRGGMAHEEFVR